MNMMDLFKSCLGKIRNIRKGFTLTEILIALAVIAIIVVLVLPVVTSRAQNKSFALAYDAEVKEIFSSLEGLTLNENAKSFNDTMMNVSTPIAEGANAEEVASSALNALTDTNPGLFLKKYTKVAKYCGATPGTCFAQAYFRYNGRRRGNFDFANIVTGNGNATYRVRGNENDLRYDNMACALLKNGMSLCISPQVTATNGDVLRPVRGFIDLNGPKEPNVLGRDLRSFSMDLSTRQIASVEAAEVVNPEGPVACQDGECCEQRHNSGDLQQNDACCNTLIAEYGWDDGVTLQYCCNASHATKDDACCQKLYSELGDGAPPQCKPEEEKTACDKLEEGDNTQLAACCNDRSDDYWSENDWNTQCCDLNDAFKTQCCKENETYKNANTTACCTLTGSTAPECDTCSEANWTDNCCSTVSRDTDLWKNKCCSKAEYANTTACCNKTQDGINGAGTFSPVCCGQGEQKSEECCNAKWEATCCQVISSDAARRSNAQWQDKCCSDSEYANKDYCCKDDEGTAGDGTKKAICCSNEKTYTFEHTCCKKFNIGCPASCENDDYFEKNLTQCCKEKPDDERCSCSTKWVSNTVCCPGANSTDFLKHNCCKDVPDDVKCCTQDGENGGGRISEVCCKQPGLSKRGIEWCCEDGFLEGDICGNPNCEENHITLVKTERAEQGMQVPTHYTDLKIKSERPVEVAQNVIVKYTIHHYKNQSKEPYEQIETSVEDKQDTLTIGVGEKESKTLTLWTRDCPGFGPGCDPQQYTEIKSITVSKDHDDACYPYSDEPSGTCTINANLKCKLNKIVLNTGCTRSWEYSIKSSDNSVHVCPPNPTYKADIKLASKTGNCAKEPTLKLNVKARVNQYYECTPASLQHEHGEVNIFSCTTPCTKTCTMSGIGTQTCTAHADPSGPACDCQNPSIYGQTCQLCADMEATSYPSEVEASASDSNGLVIVPQLEVSQYNSGNGSGTATYTEQNAVSCTDAKRSILYELESDSEISTTLTYTEKTYNSNGDEIKSQTKTKSIKSTAPGAAVHESVLLSEKYCPEGCSKTACGNTTKISDVKVAAPSGSDCEFKLSMGDECQFPDEPSGGGTCSDYASDRTNPKWTELSCCTKDEYYNDISCCSGNKDGKGNTSLNCCKANNPSINDSEHECCAVGYDSMGCCSADSSDDGCCTYAIETKGEKLNPDHICCSSNKYKNDPRCMTPCQKVENGTNSIADTKACCDEKGNAYWTSNNWAQTCCLNVFDNQGYYAYRGEAQCCPYIKDNGGLLTCYGPSHPEQCCSSLDKNACTGKGISSSDACWNTCYKADGSPDTSKGVVCCSIWNNDGKLNDGAKSLCCNYPEFKSAHSDVCEDTPETCTPYSYSSQNALEQVSEDCCKKWVNGGATTPFELALKESVDMGQSIIPQVAEACCQYQSFRDIGEFNKLCCGNNPTAQKASAVCCNYWGLGKIGGSSVNRACCGIKEWTDGFSGANANSIGFCCAYGDEVNTSDNQGLADVCNLCNFNSITFTLTCGPDSPVNSDQCGNNTTYRCSVTDNRPKYCPVSFFSYANLKINISHLVLNPNATSVADMCKSGDPMCYKSGSVSEGLALGRNQSVLLTPGVYYTFDTKCRFVSQTGSEAYIATESLSPSADCPSGACNYVTSTVPSAPNQLCNFIDHNNWFGTERGGGTFSCSRTYNMINGQWR